ncbi:MAG TPA: flavodoxin-dependent (E)-4-hydroxy-3-methylbut-2-enyl-diphosphate synthase, partial [Gemmataceae bacterium]|nr:flavodoxin-dependent (E)-4-hydroxy-3-methylbut-2-enyl-diphosphate synthase [Gemmataceae bacterium]
VKISVLGCVVNGPGEAREADIGIAAGNGKGMIFRNGEIVRRVDEQDIVGALMEEVARWEAENKDKLPQVADAEGIGRRKLPVIAG